MWSKTIPTDSSCYHDSGEVCYRNMLHIANYSKFELYLPHEHLRPLPAKLELFYLFDPCRAKNLTSDFSSITTKLYVVDRSSYYTFGGIFYFVTQLLNEFTKVHKSIQFQKGKFTSNTLVISYFDQNSQFLRKSQKSVFCHFLFKMGLKLTKLLKINFELLFGLKASSHMLRFLIFAIFCWLFEFHAK